MSGSNKFYLDCPYEEKDQVKALGAQWDGSAKQWFVPRKHYTNLTKFSHWIPHNGRLYLICPFDEKDQAKEAGAKWDPQAKAWYVLGPFTAKKMKQFSNWFTDEGSAKSDNTPPAKPKASSRGNADDAATLKISDSMTVSQLQEECKTRGIKGLSGKNKDWLLEQLGVGSTWQTMSMKMTPAANKKPVAKTKETPNKKPAEAKKKPAAKATPKQSATKKGTSVKKKSPTASSTRETKDIDLASLPRVSTKLTVAQLTYELLHRQPDTKGASNKPKAWFVEQLGEHSIWSTSPQATEQDLSNLTLVSSSQTIAQLTHEIMARHQQAGLVAKGLSGKNKQDLLKMLGVGSILTTGAVSKQSGITPAKPPAKKKEPSSVKASKPKDSTTNKRPPKPDSVKSKSVSTSTPSTRPPVAAKISSSSATVTVADKEDQNRVLVVQVKKAAAAARKTTRKPESELSSSGASNEGSKKAEEVADVVTPTKTGRTNSATKRRQPESRKQPSPHVVTSSSISNKKIKREAEVISIDDDTEAASIPSANVKKEKTNEERHRRIVGSTFRG
ncbi:Domain of unknown function (DUF1738) [Seminavis robusta]|uniref:DUF5710 domain-containing protein n=1 Tax=Seminavis robusta TaxID=568900 RepID=A0A9N8E1L7_9STRA|nr:Domain of unknown function (DUF1738) [Seminavis robusta]|eukprot:Sro415_g138480.1 Domain of unknown function (DUF1738) (558) ;mRNA; f:17759-19432